MGSEFLCNEKQGVSSEEVISFIGWVGFGYMAIP